MDKRVEKSEFSNYFFVERFTKPVSPLGWSLLGDLIEERAFKQPLRRLGLFKQARGKLVHLIDGYPFVKNEILRQLFQIVPRKLVTQDKLNSFMRKDDLKDFNFSFVFTHFQYMAFNALKDPNWIPAYHFFKWKQFRYENEKFFKDYKRKDVSELEYAELLDELEYLRVRSDAFLALHRWSFIFSEIVYGMLKGLVRRWIPSTKIDEDIEIAQKLCTGFEENTTAQMDRALRTIAHQISQLKNPEELLDEPKRINKFITDFIDTYGYRSESLDIFYPTWAEDTTFLIDMLRAMVPVQENKSYLHIQKAIELREDTTQFCIEEIKKNYPPIINLGMVAFFKSLLRITQRFMILREVQRDQWHKILSQKRRVVLQIAKQLYEVKKLNDIQDIFFLTTKEIQQRISNELTTETLTQLISDRRKEYKENLTKKIVKKSTSTGQRELRGIGVSTGITKGRTIILNSVDEMKNVQPGDILVTHIIDSSWTPVFNIISGLITEVGGMLSHGAVVAREMGIPAIVGLKDATAIIPEGVEVTMNGKNGIIHQ